MTYKTAWFMEHRVRDAMRSGDLAPFGPGGGFVEVDETFIGNDKDVIRAKAAKDHKKPRRAIHKFRVLALFDRGTGRARTMVVDDLKAKTLAPILNENIAREAILMTDELGTYKGIGKGFADHKRVRHGMGDYVNRKNPEIHTNTAEGWSCTNNSVGPPGAGPPAPQSVAAHRSIAFKWFRERI